MSPQLDIDILGLDMITAPLANGDHRGAATRVARGRDGVPALPFGCPGVDAVIAAAENRQGLGVRSVGRDDGGVTDAGALIRNGDAQPPERNAPRAARAHVDEDEDEDEDR